MQAAATPDCLALRRPPPRECSAEWTAPGCLQSAVRRRIPHATLEACFRCCLVGATEPLQANSRFWRHVWLNESRDPWGIGAAGKSRGAPGRLLGFNADDSVLINPLSGSRYADSGATYSNATVVNAPLWRRQPSPYYTSIYGWGPMSSTAMHGWIHAHPRAPHVLYTSGAQLLPQDRRARL